MARKSVFEAGRERTGTPEGLMETLEVGRLGLVDELADLTRASEANALAIGEALGVILERSQRIGAVRAGGDAEGDIRAQIVLSLQKEGIVVDGYTQALKSTALEEQETVGRCLAICAKISEVVDGAQAAAAKSRLLALNASVRAGTLGDGGRVLGVIAQEMRQASDKVTAINREIHGCARTLIAQMTTLAEEATALVGQAESFAQDAHVISQALGEGSQRVAEIGERHAAERGQRVSEVVAAAHDALSHLQFQDPMIQTLQQLEPLVMDTTERVAAMIGLEREARESSYLKNLSYARADEAPELDEGELMLF